MKTIKFSAKSKDGIIVIPKKYQKKIINPLKVILQYNEKNNRDNKSRNQKKSAIEDFFNKYQLDQSKYKFDRNEANER